MSGVRVRWRRRARDLRAGSLADRSELEDLFWKAGFGEVQSEPLTVSFEFASTDEYIRYVQDVALPIWGLLANESQARKEGVWRAVADAHRPFEGADGVVRLSAESLVARGRR